MFKLEPFRPVREVRKVNVSSNSQDVFDQFFDSFFNDNMFEPFNKMNGKLTSFLVDVIDDGDKYIVEAELPGFEKENVKVEYRDQHLSIIASRVTKDTENKANYIRRERSWGEFKRNFYVDNIDPDRINANFENGVLQVTLHKQPLKNDSRQIKIE